MSDNFVSLREVDLKKFEGRVLSLLGEIIQKVESLDERFQDAFYMGGKEQSEDIE